ncbi:olfactory receptor 1J4-like [Phacochoerus africanus]|uniref:olfactory receptor 1J4-like n=1 Tax=Phacochoerus africanus TaxID=41426 RepID=UPI001FD9577E|nr:olfactory receptor 1J4-like [Phacochoerus africanus]
MRRENQRIMSKFLLLGLPIQPEQQGMSFALFLGMYLTTVLENLLITLIIRLDPCFPTCMYFFLSHMDLTDISFSPVTVPKMLMNMQTQDQSIPYAGYVTQIYFFACTENLLAVIAYYSYVDICHPLCYGIIMRKELCLCFLAKSWLLSCASTLTHTFLLAQLSFCTHSIIPHFFCDLATLLKPSFSDTYFNDLVIFTEGAAVPIYLLSFILISYGRIGVAVMRVSSTKGICKALSSYGSHLSVVSILWDNYGSVLFLLIRPVP